MRKRSTGSTSTSQTEPSAPWEDLSKLGEYIVAQLGDPYGENLVVHWMAHQLAEYLKSERDAESESERTVAREAASSLIIRLWQARSHWPSGWPPPEASKLKQLLEDPAPRWERVSSAGASGEPWWDAVSDIEELHREEMRIYLYGAIAELDIDAIGAALDAANRLDAADGDDLAFMRTALELRGSTDAWFAEHAQPRENPSRRAHRARIIEREIAKIDKRRHDMLRRATAHARSYRRRPSPSVPRSERANPADPGKDD